jgi:hypothetical protein
VFPITIGFSSFHGFFLDNSDLNGKSLETLKTAHEKNDIHAIWHKLRPISGGNRKLRAPSSLNMVVNLPSTCLKIV